MKSFSTRDTKKVLMKGFQALLGVKPEKILQNKHLLYFFETRLVVGSAPEKPSPEFGMVQPY